MRIQSKPMFLKERASILWLERGNIDVVDGAFVLIDAAGVRMQIPVAGLACLMLEPGIRISHAAVALAAETGTLLLWVGEGNVRLYAAGQPGGARSERLLYQAKLALDDSLRLRVVRQMYRMRFKEEPPAKRSIEQLRGIEGARVRETYKILANRYQVPWRGRDYNVKNFDGQNAINLCLSVANHCLYGVCEAAILAAGYAPAIGFIHSGKPLSFVYDIADIVKFDTVIPLAFQTCAQYGQSPELSRTMRHHCRDQFRKSKLLKRIIPLIDEVLAAGGIESPKIEGAVPIAIPNEEATGDAGHRS